DEPVVLLAAELGEVAPDVQGMMLKKGLVRMGQRTFDPARRRVEPEGRDRGERPEHQYRSCRKQCVRTGPGQGDGEGERKHGRKAKVTVERASGGARLRLRRRLPVQQVSTRDQ